MHNVSLPFVDADAGFHKVLVHGLSHALHDSYVIDARHNPAHIYATESGVLQGLQGGCRRRSVGIVKPEILFGTVQGPFEAVPKGKHLVVRRVRNNLNGNVRKLLHLRQVVHPGRLFQVFRLLQRAQPGRHAVLVFLIDGVEVCNGRAGNADIGISPVKEIFVLDVAAAHVTDLAVYQEDFPMIPVGCQVGPHIVQQHDGPVEKIHLYAIFLEGGKLLEVPFLVGGFVQDDTDIHSAAGLFPQDAFNYASGRICAETVVVYVDGLFGIFQVFLQDVPFLLPVCQKGYGIAFRGLQPGVLFHEGGQRLVGGTYAGISRGVLHYGNIGLVQRGPVTAPCKQQHSSQEEGPLYLHHFHKDTIELQKNVKKCFANSKYCFTFAVYY